MNKRPEHIHENVTTTPTQRMSTLFRMRVTRALQADVAEQQSSLTSSNDKIKKNGELADYREPNGEIRQSMETRSAAHAKCREATAEFRTAQSASEETAADLAEIMVGDHLLGDIYKQLNDRL